MFRPVPGLGLATALLAAACQGHHATGAAGRELCGAATPALFKRLQGRWEVAFKEYTRGQKPPTKPRIGALEIDECRFRFIAREHAASGNAGKWLPFVRVPTGTLEIVAEGPPATGADAEPFRVWLGTVLLHVDAGAEGVDAELPSIWEAMVFARPQEGEYLYFAPATMDEPLPWQIDRGEFRLRPGEFVPGSDPDAFVDEGTLTRMRRQQAP